MRRGRLAARRAGEGRVLEAVVVDGVAVVAKEYAREDGDCIVVKIIVTILG